MPDLPVAPDELVHHTNDLIVLYQWVLSVSIALLLLSWGVFIAALRWAGKWIVSSLKELSDTIEAHNLAMKEQNMLEKTRQQFYRGSDE